MTRKLRNETPNPEHRAWRWQHTYEVLSLDVVHPLWRSLNLDLPIESQTIVSRAAKVAYKALLGDQWIPYEVGYSAEKFEATGADFGIVVGEAVREQIEHWTMTEFKHTTREGVVEAQLFSGLMAIWHDGCGCRASMPVSPEANSIVIDAIGVHFWPRPYEMEMERLEDSSAYSDWDRLVSSGYGGDEPAWIASVSNNLTDASVRALFRGLQVGLSLPEYEAVREWCLEYNWNEGPYAGGNVKDPTLFSDE